MKTVHEIEKELEEAKKQQRLVYLQKELQELKLQYEGKAFGTHTFERKNKSSFNYARFYEKFWIEEGKIKMLSWNITITRMGKNYAFSQDSLSFDRSKKETVSEHNGRNAKYNLIGYDFGAKKEIPVSRFMKLWEYGEITSIKLNEAYTTIVEESPFDLLRIGSSNDEKILADAFDYLKLDVIDITQYPKVFSVLQYKHLPFLQEQKYLPRIYAKQILEYQIKLWQEEKNQTWRSYDDRYDKWIEVIKDFIKTI
jgi:hypothetical protein